MTPTRYIVTMEVDVEGVTDERRVKHQIAYALGMAIADRTNGDPDATCKVVVGRAEAMVAPTI